MLILKNVKTTFPALVLFALALVVNFTAGCVSIESGPDLSPERGVIAVVSSELCEDDLSTCEQGRIDDADACEAARQQTMADYEASRVADIAQAVSLCDESSATAAEILAAPIGQNPNFPSWIAPGPAGMFYAVASVEHPDGSGPVIIVGAFAVDSVDP